MDQLSIFTSQPQGLRQASISNDTHSTASCFNHISRGVIWKNRNCPSTRNWPRLISAILVRGKMRRGHVPTAVARSSLLCWSKENRNGTGFAVTYREKHLLTGTFSNWREFAVEFRVPWGWLSKLSTEKRRDGRQLTRIRNPETLNVSLLAACCCGDRRLQGWKKSVSGGKLLRRIVIGPFVSCFYAN